MANPLDRRRGALWGQAVGDALGTTAEFSTAATIASWEAGAWPRDIVGHGPFAVIPGQVTDDTELALALARSLARLGRYDEDDVAAAYVRWRKSDPIDVGGATNQAFGKPVVGAGIAAEVRARASRQTQANGSLMRASPLGVFGADLPRAALAALARADSALSHPHEVCQSACAVFVTTIADAISTGLPGPQLYARALDFAKGTPVEDTLHAAAHGLPASDGDDMGWVRIALQHAFFALNRATNFEEALVASIRQGGDTDTNAAITGALLGAALGVEAIPLHWRETVRDALPVRPPEYRCGELDALVAALRPR